MSSRAAVRAASLAWHAEVEAAGEKLLAANEEWTTNLRVQDMFGARAHTAFVWLKQRGWERHYVTEHVRYDGPEGGKRVVRTIVYLAPSVSEEDACDIVNAEKAFARSEAVSIAEVLRHDKPHYINTACRRMALVTQARWARRTA